MSRTSITAALKERLVAKPNSRHGAIHAAAGSLRAGAVHEWFGVAGAGAGEQWCPALCLLSDLARRAVERDLQTRVVWIGRWCWPYPLLLDEQRSLLAASVFIDPPDHASRLWCVDVASRCPHPTLVIADGSGLTLANSRRLQLAAASGVGACVLARPPRELGELSAATTRWVVSHERSESQRPRWAVTLVRDKDRPVFKDDAPRAVVEWDHASGLVRVSASVVDRAVRTAAEAS